MKKIRRFAVPLVVLVSLSAVGGPVQAGSPIGGDRFLIYNLEGVSEENSAIAYNHERQEYLVVWEGTEIWGQRLSRHGTRLGSAFRISPSYEGRNPDVTYSSAANEYFVVWNDSSDVHGQFISDLGTLQGAVIHVALGYLAPPGFDGWYYDQPALAYGATSDRYLVTYRYRSDSDGGSRIWGVVLMSDGTPVDLGYGISDYSSTGLPEQPDVAYLRTRNEFLVVWQQTVAGDVDVYARRFKLTGGPGPLDMAFPVANFLSDHEVFPAVAAIPTVVHEGQYLVAFEVDTGTDHNIMARAVSWDGTVGAWPTLADTGWGEYRPAVAGSETNDQFLVTWTWVPVITPSARMEVQARTVALDGTPLDDVTLVGGGQVYDSAVAVGSTGDFLVAFDDNEVFGTASRGIYGRLWGNRVYLPLVLRDKH